MKFQISHITDKGLRRSNNEDFLGYIPDLYDSQKDSVQGNYSSLDEVVLVVCDGMGGLEAGEVASKHTTEFLLDYLRKGIALSDNYELLIHEALVKSNKNLHQTQRNLGINKEMGTTVVVVIIGEFHCYFGWVGDSRAYLFRNGKLQSLTKDHSKVQADVDAGLITEEEAFYSDESHIITQSIGQRDTLIPGTGKILLELNDRIFLCTDGVCGEILDNDIRNCFDHSGDDKETLRAIKERVFEVYANDNLSMILFSMLEFDSKNKPLNNIFKKENKIVDYSTKEIRFDTKHQKGWKGKKIILIVTLIIVLAVAIYYFLTLPILNNNVKSSIKDSISNMNNPKIMDSTHLDKIIGSNKSNENVKNNPVLSSRPKGLENPEKQLLKRESSKTNVVPKNNVGNSNNQAKKDSIEAMSILKLENKVKP